MTIPKLKIKESKKISDVQRLKKALNKKLIEFNEQVGLRHGDPRMNIKHVALEVRDQRGKLQAGLFGVMFWGWLYVDYLWVDAMQRKAGFGTKLIRQAEKVAKRQGCRDAFLSTFSFQAPGFYRKLGYCSFGVLRDFPKGEQRYWMKKVL